MECELRDNPVFPQSLAARPALLLLTALDRLPAVQAYLNSDPPIEDSFEFDAASLAVPIAKVPEEPAREHPLLARYRAEAWFNERDFSHSQLRFIRAYRFWTDGSSSDRN